MVAADETTLVLHIGDISYSVGYVRGTHPWPALVFVRACFRRRRYRVGVRVVCERVSDIVCVCVRAGMRACECL